eukprot:2303080-Prymnesium_polylepis.1
MPHPVAAALSPQSARCRQGSGARAVRVLPPARQWRLACRPAAAASRGAGGREGAAASAARWRRRTPATKQLARHS